MSEIDVVYSDYDPLKKFELSRHKNRPHIRFYIDSMIEDFVELRGDRYFGDDGAMLCGIGKFDGIPVTVIGQVKGKNLKENIDANFGMSHPEGYRKAMRQMKLAEKFHRPIITFVDTPGAEPGAGAEERGQSEAIAVNLRDMMGLRTPIISVMCGEGGSGGALGIACANVVLMLENATYSVISPKGCATILWKDAAKEKEAASSLKMTAEDLLSLNVIEAIIKEPQGGAHVNPQQTAKNVKEKISEYLPALLAKPPEIIYNERYQKFRRIGIFGKSE